MYNLVRVNKIKKESTDFIKHDLSVVTFTAQGVFFLGHSSFLSIVKRLNTFQPISFFFG